MKIGFIGIGVMGSGMIRNLRKAGYDVEIYARSTQKAKPLTDEGVVLAESVPRLCKGKDVLITIIGAPKDVEAMYLGENGVLDNMAPGSVVIDMTTSSPSLAKRIYAEAKTKGISALDAPVSGGSVGARDATMTIMPAGDKEAVDKVMPLFQAMGKNIFYMGEAGCGQSTKLANQIACAGAIGALLDTNEYANALGLDKQRLFEVLVTCTASSYHMKGMYPRLLSGNFEPGFMIKHFVKDLLIAKGEVEARGGSLPIVDKMLGYYEKMMENGQQELDFSAVIENWK